MMFISISSWILCVLTAGITLYWYLTKRHNHWKQVGIPYVTAIPILGSFGGLIRKPLHELEVERYTSKGRIHGIYEGRSPVLIVADPDVLKDIFVKDFHIFANRRAIPNNGNDNIANYMLPNVNGETWKRIRTLITPTFTTGKIKKMTSIFIDSAKTLSDNFKKAAIEGKPLDVKRYFGAFSMDVIASCAFGAKLDSHSDPDNPFVSAARKMFGGNISWRLLCFLLCPGLLKIFGISPFAPGPFEFFRQVTLKTIKERNERGQKRNDFLQLMMDAEAEFEKDESLIEKDAISEMGHEENNDQILKPIRGFRSLSHDEMVAQCIIFFLAGFEATAATMSNVVYELALNPDIQEKLIADIDGSIEEKGALTYESISEMKYLDCVVSETLRKYPPGIRAERVPREDYVIKNHNIPVPKGMVVGIPIYAMHQDPEYYPYPEIFDPERFTPEMKASRPPFTYLPFGAGPRNCVAMRFALMEVKVCLAYVLSQFRFHTCSQTMVPMQFYFGQGALSPKEVMLKIELRADPAQF